MRIDHLDLLIHLEQNALASPGSGFCPPSTTLVFMVALCNGFHNTTLNLRSRSPLAHLELIYIYNRPTAVTYTQRRSRSIRSNFIPNDCTFGLFRLLPVRQDYIGRVRREMSFSLRSRWPGSSRSSLYRYRYIF